MNLTKTTQGHFVSPVAAAEQDRMDAEYEAAVNRILDQQCPTKK